MAERELTGILYDDSETNVENLRRDAEGGSVNAMNQLGQMYMDGNKVPKDDEEAAEWFYQSASQRYEDETFEKEAVQDPWQEREMSRGEMVKRLRNAVADLNKKGELERQEQMLVIPSALSAQNTKKRLPGKFMLICFILSGIVTVSIWQEIFEISEYKWTLLWQGFEGIFVSLADGIETLEFILLGRLFLPPVLCVLFLIAWIFVLVRNGKKGEDETKRLKDAQNQANSQKEQLKASISLTAKSVQEKLPFLPDRYHSAASCEALAQIFEDMRADSLKEALNIYSLENAGGGAPKRQKVSKRGL